MIHSKIEHIYNSLNVSLISGERNEVNIKKKSFAFPGQRNSKMVNILFQMP